MPLTPAQERDLLLWLIARICNGMGVAERSDLTGLPDIARQHRQALELLAAGDGGDPRTLARTVLEETGAAAADPG